MLKNEKKVSKKVCRYSGPFPQYTKKTIRHLKPGDYLEDTDTGEIFVWNGKDWIDE